MEYILLGDEALLTFLTFVASIEPVTYEKEILEPVDKVKERKGEGKKKGKEDTTSIN